MLWNPNLKSMIKLMVSATSAADNGISRGEIRSRARFADVSGRSTTGWDRHVN